MMYIHRNIKDLAKEELSKRDIDGTLLSVRFVLNDVCPMIRISFTSDIQPTLVLTGFDYLEHQDDEYHLYLAIDTMITIKQNITLWKKHFQSFVNYLFGQ